MSAAQVIDLASRRPIAPPSARTLPTCVAIVAAVFGPGGVLERAGRERRDGQVRLAEAIAATLDAVGPTDSPITTPSGLLAEGPCGTGKTFAYLVPLLWWCAVTGRKGVVAVHNIALQEQLLSDVPVVLEMLAPLLAEHELPAPTAAVYKGRGNFLCLARVGEPVDLAGRPTPFDLRSDVARIDAWAQGGPAAGCHTGDRAELPLVVADGAWRLRTVDRDDCLGDGCDHYDDCYAMAARGRAHAASLIVTNYHLLSAHIAVRREIGAEAVLPPHGAVICDEAHTLSDIAREFFGHTLTRALTGRAERWLRQPRAYVDDDTRRDALAALAPASEALWAHIESVAHAMPSKPVAEKTMRLTGPVLAAQLLPYGDALHAAQKLAARCANGYSREGVEGLSQEQRAEMRRAQNLARRLRSALSWFDSLAAPQDSPDEVHWIEREQRDGPGTAWSVRVQSRPLDPGPVLHAHLWARERQATVAVSATLTTGMGTAGWSFARRQLGALGAQGPKAVSVPSPFDFARQALLCLPRGMAHPTQEREVFDAQVADTLVRVVRAAHGRTLGLFTSHRVTRLAADALRAARLPYRILVQGEMPRGRLVQAFRDDPSSVLLGTASLWTGVDVQGEACVAVVIDRLPYPNPSEPVHAALSDAAVARTGNRWAGLDEEGLPRAVLALRQGAGRLIRSRADWGAVVICDPRLRSGKSGPGIRAALGFPVQCDSVADVEAFFADRARGITAPRQGALGLGMGVSQ